MTPPPAGSAGLAAARPALLALAVALAAWVGLFHSEIARAVEVWDGSTAYSHCWFVLPIALYLAWDRRAAAAGMAPRPLRWPALLALPGVLAWLLAERVGVMEGRQLVAMGFVLLLFLAVLGWRLAWVFSAALLYLVFLVPFGAFLTGPLQRFTAAFTDIGLDLSGIPYVMDQLTIDIPEGRFYIAEACAGLRFLIASIAFGVLYACLIYRSPWRRAAFILVSCIVPVIANGFRALGIVVLGHVLGSAEAAAADHILYGWVFFSTIILLLILAGLPFRQDREEPPPPRPAAVAAAAGGSPWLAAGLVMAAAAAGPAVAAAIDRAGAAALPAVVLPGFAAAPGCTAADPASIPGEQHFVCDGLPLTATVQVFPPRANPGLLIVARRSAGTEEGAEDLAIGRLDGLPDWRLAETQQPDRIAATALWIDGDAGLGGLAGRLRQARNSILGGGLAPVLMAVRLDSDGEPLGRDQRAQAREAIRAFIAAQGDLQAVATGLARAAAAAQ